jgi:[acyl-carrier-protein] S-malonyltransferase
MDTSSRQVALVFPGQGSQFVGMGQSLAENFSIAKETYLEAENILEKPITQLMWNGPEAELNDTINTQPALFVHSIAAYRVFQLNTVNIAPLFFAGHSLGQISAAVAAGALSFTDGVKLVKRRGELMKRAGVINPGGMAAIFRVGNT